MRPMRLILDHTRAAKEMLEDLEKNSFKSEFAGADTDDTTLSAYYHNGEHACTFPEVRNAKSGRKAAKRFMKYCECTFEDRTKGKPHE